MQNISADARGAHVARCSCVERLLRAIGYPDRAPEAALSFTLLVDEIKDEDGGSAGPAQSPSDAEFLRRRLSAAFAKLPPVLRDAYTLFQVAELPIHEIARQTGVSENLVKVRIFRAKQKLQEILSDLRGA